MDLKKFLHVAAVRNSGVQSTSLAVNMNMFCYGNL